MTTPSSSFRIDTPDTVLASLQADPTAVGMHYLARSLREGDPENHYAGWALNELGRRLFIGADFMPDATYANDHLVPGLGHRETVIEGVWRHRPTTPLQSMYLRVGLEHGLAVRSANEKFYADIRLDQPDDRAFVQRADGLSLPAIRLATDYVESLADALASYQTIARARWEPEVRRIFEKPRMT